MGKIAFSIGPLHFFWYGLILAAAILAALLVSLWQARLRQERLEPVVDLVLCGIPVGLFFARIYYVLINWPLYTLQPGEIFYFWHGGLALDGAFFGLILLLYGYTRKVALSFWRYSDIVTPGVAIGQAIGLWGNLMNQEAFGYPTDKAWGIYIDFADRPLGFQEFDFFRPLFMYESGWNIILFLVLLVAAFIQIRYQRLKQGTLFLLYLLFFSAGRLFFEGLRIDIEPASGVLTIGQVISIVFMVGAFITLVQLYRRDGH